MSFTVLIDPPSDRFADIVAIRRAVFVQEQGIDPAVEFDGKDTTATQVLGVRDGEPVGTARLRHLDETTMKVERMSVRKPHRHHGVGRRLIEAILDHATEAGYTSLVLHAQIAVAEFYETAGFERVSEPFEEVGRPHVRMVYEL
jgi:predicted GNAT family N-acyltransferase